MCRKDKDCEAGQRCIGGVCTDTALDELADTDLQPKIELPKEDTPCDP